MRIKSWLSATVVASLLVGVSLLTAGTAQAQPSQGTVVTLAGGGVDDGLQATSVPLAATDAVPGPNGSLIITDPRSNRIRSVSSSGTISTIAGTGSPVKGSPVPSGDGGPATSAMLGAPQQAIVTTDGDIDFDDLYSHRIRQIDATTGDISTIAGNGNTGTTAATTDATTTPLDPAGIAYDPTSGDLYILSSDVVWSLAGDGSLTAVAGGGSGTMTNGGSATAGRFTNDLTAVAVMANGTVLVSTQYNVYAVSGGDIDTVAGNGEYGTTQDGANALQTPFYISSLAAASDGTIYVGGGSSLVSFTIGGDAALLPSAPCTSGVSIDSSGRPLLSCNAVFDDEATGWQRVAGTSIDDFDGSSVVPDGVTTANAELAANDVLQQDGKTYFTDGTTINEFGSDGIIHRIAGSPDTTTSTGDGGTAAAATFKAAETLLPAPADGIYVRDANEIRLITSDGDIHAYAGSRPSVYSDPPNGTPAADLGGILDVAAAADGDIYVGQGSSILVINHAHQTVETIAQNVADYGPPPVSYDTETPVKLAVEPNGDLLALTQISTNNQPAQESRVLQIDPATGAWQQLYDGAALKTLSVTKDGTIYAISTTASAQIVMIGTDGSVTAIAGGGSEAGASQSIADFYVDPYETLAPAADGGLLINSYLEGRIFELNATSTAAALDPVTALHASVSTSGGRPAIDLSWDAPATVPDDGNILVGLGSGSQSAPIDPTDDSLALNSTTTSIRSNNVGAGLVVGMRYVISVYVSDGNGDLSPAASIAVVIPGDTTAPGQPGVDEGFSNNSSFELLWQDPSDADFAKTELRIAKGSVAPSQSSAPIFSDSPNTEGQTEHTVTGLTVGDEYTFTLTSYDFSGNASAVRTYDFVAGSAPLPTWLRAPANGGFIGRSIDFTVYTDPLPGEITCTVDGVTTKCGGQPIQLSNLVNGSKHTVTAQVSGPLGAGALETRTWTVDTVAPKVAVTPLAAVELSPKVKLDYRATDAGSGVAGYSVRTIHTTAKGTFSSWTAGTTAAGSGTTLPVAAGETVCAEVAATDAVGNSSIWSAPTCTTRPTDDRKLNESHGWTKRTGRGYYLGTISTADAKAASLTLAATSLDRVALVATRCPSCGTVKVSVGKKTVATVSLKSAKTQNQWIDLLPRMATESASVRLIVASQGKPVMIDGLAAIGAPRT